MRWWALGQRLLRRGAIWVRDGADRVLIRLRARNASFDEAPNREAFSAVPNGPENGDRDRPASVPPGGDEVPEHWRTRVRTAPPRHWLERVEAARRRFKAVWIDAVVRPKVPASLPPAEDSSSLELLRHPPRSHEGMVFEPASGRLKAPREEEPPAVPPHQSVAAVDRDSAGHPSRPGPTRSWTFVDAPQQRAGSTQRAPAARGAEPGPRGEGPSSPPLERDHELGTRPRRPPLPPVEPFAWSTPPRGEGVQSPHKRQNERKENTSAAGPAPAVRPLRWDPSATSSGGGDLAWTNVVAPAREYGAERPRVESPEPVRSRAGATDERSFPESSRAWPPFLPPDPWQRSMAPGPESDVVAAARSYAACEEAFFYTNEPADRWPALPDAPSADDEDWPAMKRRLERRDRLDREQRGW